MARRYQLKVYSLNAVTLIGTIADNHIFEGRVSRTLNSEDTLTFNIDFDSASYAYLVLSRVVSLINSTDSITRNYRIKKITKKHDGSIYYAEVYCEHLHYDLANVVHSFSGEVIKQTPTTQLTQILAGSGWTVGTVTPTALLTLSYNYNTVLFDLEQLREATGYDLSFTTTVGASPTKIVNLVTIGSASASTVAFAKNILNLSIEDNVPKANTVIGVGGEGINGLPMSLATATHRIASKAANLVTFTSDKIISSTNSFAGKDLADENGENIATIISSNKQVGGNDQIVVDDDTLIIVGDSVIITQAGTPKAGLTYIDDKSSVDTYGRITTTFKDESLADVRNLVAPEASSTLSGTYTAGLCEGWNLAGNPFVAENTDTAFIINGTKSQKVYWSGSAPAGGTPILALGSAGNLTGTYQYKFCLISNDGESPLSATAASISPSAQRVIVDKNYVIGDGHSVGWRIYRTKAGGSTFYKLADVDDGTATFTDDIPDDLLTVAKGSDTAWIGGNGVYREFDAVVGSEYAAVVNIIVVSGRVRVELSAGETFPDKNITSLKRATPTTSGTQRWTVTIEGLVSSGTAGRISVLMHEGAAEYYVDSVMVVKSAYAPSADRFVADNSATELWYLTYDELQRLKDASQNVNVDIADLHEAGDAADLLKVGDTITVADSKFSYSTSIRILGKSFDLLEPWNCQVSVSEPFGTFTQDYKDIKIRENIFGKSLSRNSTRIAKSLRSSIGSKKQPIITISELGT